MPFRKKITRRRSSRIRKTIQINERENIEILIKFIQKNKNTKLFIDDSMSNELCISTREGLCSKIILFTNLNQVNKQTLISIFEHYNQ